jgi:hypothetical protein
VTYIPIVNTGLMGGTVTANTDSTSALVGVGSWVPNIENLLSATQAFLTNVLNIQNQGTTVPPPTP